MTTTRDDDVPTNPRDDVQAAADALVEAIIKLPWSEWPGWVLYVCRRLDLRYGRPMPAKEARNAIMVYLEMALHARVSAGEW